MGHRNQWTEHKSLKGGEASTGSAFLGESSLALCRRCCGPSRTRSNEITRQQPMAHNNIPTSAQVIANYFLWLSNESGSFLSNLKLQKVLYYAQGWHLGLERQRLFTDQIEAWVHGPSI